MGKVAESKGHLASSFDSKASLALDILENLPVHQVENE